MLIWRPNVKRTYNLKRSFSRSMIYTDLSGWTNVQPYTKSEMALKRY